MRYGVRLSLSRSRLKLLSPIKTLSLKRMLITALRLRAARLRAIGRQDARLGLREQRERQEAIELHAVRELSAAPHGLRDQRDAQGRNAAADAKALNINF